MLLQVVLNNLYKCTALQMRFPVNAVALVDGTPLTLSLKEFLQRFLEFRCEVVRRRARSAAVQRLSVDARARTDSGCWLEFNDGCCSEASCAASVSIVTSPVSSLYAICSRHASWRRPLLQPG